EDMLDSTMGVERQESLPVLRDREPLGRRVSRYQLRGMSDAWQCGCNGESRTQRDRDAQERTPARRNRSGAVTATDPDVERFVLLLGARRSPRTVDAYRRDLAALAVFRSGPVGDVSLDELERWLASMRAAGLAPS